MWHGCQRWRLHRSVLVGLPISMIGLPFATSGHRQVYDITNYFRDTKSMHESVEWIEVDGWS
jgi:hypothetical protein